MKNQLLLLSKSGIKLLGMSVVLGISLQACKDKESQTEIVPTTPAKYKALTDEGFESLMQRDTFSVAAGVHNYQSPKGTRVRIDPSCLRLNGQPVTGNVVLEFYEAYDRLDMAVANKATMGSNGNGDFEPMKTGGQYFVQVKKDGVVLNTNCDVTVEASSDLTGGTDMDMTSWNGKFEANNLLWVPADNWDVVAGQDRTYTLDLPGFGWFNCDKLYNDPRPKVALNFQVPTAYSQSSNVYAIIKGEPHSLGLANYGLWPVGMELHLIFVSETNGQYLWETKSITVANNNNTSFNLSTAKTGTRAQFAADLNTLD